MSALAARLAYVILYVADVEAALAFHERAFGVARRFLHESGNYGELETGGTALAFAAHATAEGNAGPFARADPAAPPLGFEVGYVVEDVPAAYAHAVEAGAVPVTAPTMKPWGQVVAYVRDRDGFLVELCTAVGGVA